MKSPLRVQLSRRRGWRLPPNSMSVARPTKWGNPWTVADREAAGWPTRDEAAVLRICVAAHAAWMRGEPHWAHGVVLAPPPEIAELRGKNLACWCRLDAPCHADVLLELANA